MEPIPDWIYAVGAAGFAALLLRCWRRRSGGNWLAGSRKRRMERLDRMALTHQHSVHLLSVEGKWMFLAVTPRGVDLLESGYLDPQRSDGCSRVEFPGASRVLLRKETA